MTFLFTKSRKIYCSKPNANFCNGTIHYIYYYTLDTTIDPARQKTHVMNCFVLELLCYRYSSSSCSYRLQNPVIIEAISVTFIIWAEEVVSVLFICLIKSVIFYGKQSLNTENAFAASTKRVLKLYLLILKENQTYHFAKFQISGYPQALKMGWKRKSCDICEVI